jgi:selenocysteine lyase/cysteine desulfurase
MDKRTFIKGLAVAGSSLPFTLSAGSQPLSAMAEWIARHESRSSAADAPTGLPPGAALAADEDFWAGIRSGYRLKPDYINLENGYYNILPEQTLEAFIRHVREVNYEGAYYMRTVQYERKQAVAARLAMIAGCSPGELVITRNTTESLDMIIAGYPWASGDEAIIALQDYGAMLQMFRQVSHRHGVVCRTVSLPNHPAGDEELVTLYEKAITPRTRLLMVSHMVNVTGQILPVRKIADMAHAHGVEVMVDGAHSFAHIRHSIPELGCDFYGASLHKWLSVPLGAGILYVRKELTNKIWPLLAEADGAEGIARLNHTGTLPVHTDLAINDAIDYYTTLGPERKEARLRYLQQYWTGQVRPMPNVILNTPAEPGRTCAIANVGIKGIMPGDLAARLLHQYKIYTVAIDMPDAGVQGCRITPNIFTLPSELDSFVAALKEMATA